MTWLDASELRVGLGCMRLDERAVETIAAAVDAGVTVFDTARAYGDNERLVARAVGSAGRIVTKGGMARTGGAWIPDGRARTIRADCEASLAALDGVPIDLYLVHAPDPRTPWRTTVRALARLVDEGLVRGVGVANVNRVQLDEALAHAPIAAVQVGLSVLDDRALRGGVVERCEEAGLALIAHSPLGGPKRAARLARNDALAEVAAAHGATAEEVALAWLLALSPSIVAIPGARRPETARSAASAATLELGEHERNVIAPARAASRPRGEGEVVLVMGIPGAGKSVVAEEYVARGYLRLNRDERGGSLRELAAALDDALASGRRRVVLDNTYLTRAGRSYVVEAAAQYGVAARCVLLDTSLAQAQVNLVMRLLDRFGRLPSPDELQAASKQEAGLLMPTSQMRAVRELEPPSDDEGFDDVERREFARAATGSRPGVFVAAAALRDHGWRPSERDAPHLVFDWNPDAPPDVLTDLVELVSHEVDAPVAGAVCPHGGGPPKCWCRPPLPGLVLAFAREHDIELSRSTLVGAGPAHRTLAAALGARFAAAGSPS